MDREHASEARAPMPKSMIVLPAITTYAVLAACVWSWPQLLGPYCVAVLGSAFVGGFRGSGPFGFRDAAGIVGRSWLQLGTPFDTSVEQVGPFPKVRQRAARSMLAFWPKLPAIWLVAAVMASASMFYREDAEPPVAPPAPRAQNARRLRVDVWTEASKGNTGLKDAPAICVASASRRPKPSPRMGSSPGPAMVHGRVGAAVTPGGDRRRVGRQDPGGRGNSLPACTAIHSHRRKRARRELRSVKPPTRYLGQR